MKTLQNRILNLFVYLLTTVVLLTGFSSHAFSQGKKIYVGTGSGYIDYPTAQATLNLHDDDTVMINAGQYKYMNFKNITASPGHRIYIMNSGQVEFNDPSPSTFSNLTNVDIRGDGTPGIEFGFYMHDLIRAIYIDGTMTSVYFSYIKMVNIADYSIFLYNPSLTYDGTNNPNSLYYDLKFLHFSVYNIMATFLEMGVYTRIVDDGLINMARKLEVAYVTIDYTDQQDVLHLDKVVNANVHHNRFSHLGKNDFRHTGIIYLYGNGDVHHNYISDYWGSGLRAHGFSLDTVGTVNVYDNVMVNSRKYSAVEAQITPEDIAYSPYVHYCNYKIYNNTFGNLSAYDWNASMIDTYNAVGGTIEIKNNLGFNIQRDKPYNPSWNYIYQQLNITVPDTANNIYSQTYQGAGLLEDTSCYLSPGSPAIDKGMHIAMVTDDLDGIARPQGTAYDIGGREYVSGVVYPVANAGRDTSTVLPADSVKLNGAGSYNPGGGALTYKWSQVSGPSAAVIKADTSITPLLDSLKKGTYRIKLTVTNTLGYSNSDTVVIVASTIPVSPPVARAGGAITITLPVNSVSLNGTGSVSNGGGPLKYVWTKISGPIAYTLTADSTAVATAANLVHGTYHFNLTVTDTLGFTSSDTATVTINLAPMPTANAGADINVVLPVNTATLGGSGSSNPDGTALTYIWTQVSGPSTYTITGTNTATPVLTNLGVGVYQFELTVTNTAGVNNYDFVNVTVTASHIAVANAGADINLVLPANSVSLNGAASYSTDGGALTYAWTLLSGPSSFAITGDNTATPAISNLTAGTYQVQLTVTNTQGYSASDVVAVIVSSAPVTPPVSSAGADVTITLPTNAVSLNGDQSYNPGGGTLTYSWSQLSGPASFTITGATTATPVVSNLTVGTYQVQLTVTNTGGLSATDVVVVTVNPAGPPVSIAGSDVTITLPANSVSLNGTQSNNPGGGVLIYAWSQLSGPSAATITNGSTATPVLGSLTAGVYQVQLTVTNTSGLTASDTVAVTVNPAANPVAKAGGNVTILLPTNSVTLDGTSSYDPSGTALTYSWVKVSGPVPFTITNFNTATPAISNLTMGVYQVKLTVTNTSGLTATDLITITVNSALLPVAVTGKDTTVSFPDGIAILDGSASYGTGGFSITTYSWKQTSGPATATIGNAAASRTSATNLQPGLYVFQLTVTDDNGQHVSAQLNVTVTNNLRSDKVIKLYPNPCTDRLNIHMVTDSIGSAMVRITSMSGIVMLRQTFQKTLLIFDEPVIVSQLPAGMYVVEVIIGNDVQLLDKFIKR